MLKNMPENGTFVDLFCGSCSIIEKIPTTYRRIANDKQKYLIAMWKSLTSGTTMFPQIINKEFYSDVRDCYNGKNDKYEDDLVGWVGFMASFNGRFFDGGYSGHSVIGKTGKARDYIAENIANIKKQVDNLQGIEWYSGNYDELDIPNGSIVYCDIPYKGTKQYATSKNFDYERFYNWCRENKDNFKIFISEYNMPDDFNCIWSKEITNAMNTTKTYKPTEKLFEIC